MPLTSEQSAVRLHALEEAEASLRIEGLDPNKDARYSVIREQLLEGTITLEEAVKAFNAHFGAVKPLAASA